MTPSTPRCGGSGAIHDFGGTRCDRCGTVKGSGRLRLRQIGKHWFCPDCTPTPTDTPGTSLHMPYCNDANCTGCLPDPPEWDLVRNEPRPEPLKASCPTCGSVDPAFDLNPPHYSNRLLALVGHEHGGCPDPFHHPDSDPQPETLHAHARRAGSNCTCSRNDEQIGTHHAIDCAFYESQPERFSDPQPVEQVGAEPDPSKPGPHCSRCATNTGKHHPECQANSSPASVGAEPSGEGKPELETWTVTICNHCNQPLGIQRVATVCSHLGRTHEESVVRSSHLRAVEAQLRKAREGQANEQREHEATTDELARAKGVLERFFEMALNGAVCDPDHPCEMCRAIFDDTRKVLDESTPQPGDATCWR